MKWILIFLLLPSITLSQCILDDNVTVNVPPIGGIYQPGQVLTFTYTINNYQGLSTNWLHGISLILGPAYDATTLAPFGMPTNNSGTGVWLWVNSITSSLSGFTVNNPGWFYDNILGGPLVLDGDPGKLLPTLSGFGINSSSGVTKVPAPNLNSVFLSVLTYALNLFDVFNRFKI